VAEIISVDTKNLSDSVNRAARVIRQNGLVVFPTRAFYGLGANPFSQKAIEKVYQIKVRDPAKPILVLIGALSDLAPLVREIPPLGMQLIKQYWPGKATFVFDAAGLFPDILTGGTGKVGIRLVAHPVAKELIRAVGMPVTGTSANKSGMPACSATTFLDSKIVQDVDLVLDSGPLKGDAGSTVIDVTVTPPKVLRKGVITFSS
jgi:L-threonylcarbamoyladenylate synthase